MAINYLSKLLSLDPNEFSSKMFQAKSNIEGLSTERIVRADYKAFTIQDFQIGIGVFESTDPKTVLPRQDEILKELYKVQMEDSLDFIFFIIVDVVNMKSIALSAGDVESDAIKEAWDGTLIQNRLYDIGNKVSRKKDFIPPLARYLKRIKA